MVINFDFMDFDPLRNLVDAIDVNLSCESILLFNVVAFLTPSIYNFYFDIDRINF
jgi:hypothetical protein